MYDFTLFADFFIPIFGKIRSKKLSKKPIFGKIPSTKIGIYTHFWHPTLAG